MSTPFPTYWATPREASFSPPEKPIETAAELRVHLARQVREARDEDLRRLIIDASVLLGCSTSHDFGRQVIEQAMDELGARAAVKARRYVDLTLKVKL